VSVAATPEAFLAGQEHGGHRREDDALALAGVEPANAVAGGVGEVDQV
jgi:hypothetical protein